LAAEKASIYNPRVPTVREQEGGLGEASRLLQEGLQLLDERSREVDALIEGAEHRAQELTSEAEQRAQEITAEAERRAEEITSEAERQRLELEREVADLRAEVERLRDERATITAATAERASPEATRREAGDAEPEIEPIDPDAPRWGRRSNATGATQAVKRSSRSRWLPRWLHF